jgi:hypothetical protein
MAIAMHVELERFGPLYFGGNETFPSPAEIDVPILSEGKCVDGDLHDGKDKRMLMIGSAVSRKVTSLREN